MSSKNGNRSKSVFDKILNYVCVCQKSRKTKANRNISDPVPLSSRNQNEIDQENDQIQISLPSNVIDLTNNFTAKMTKVKIRTKNEISTIKVFILLFNMKILILFIKTIIVQRFQTRNGNYERLPILLPHMLSLLQ